MHWLKKNLASNLTPDARRALAERGGEADVPLVWQAHLLGVSRASLYYEGRPPREHEVAVKRRLDELYTAHPFLGSRNTNSSS